MCAFSDQAPFASNHFAAAKFTQICLLHSRLRFGSFQKYMRNVSVSICQMPTPSYSEAGCSEGHHIDAAGH